MTIIHSEKDISFFSQPSDPHPVPVVAQPRERSQRGRKAKADVSKSESTKSSKTEAVLKKLRSAKGATIQMLMETTGWQGHSVRGFLSGTVKKKLGLTLSSETDKNGIRRYRITDPDKGE